MKDKATQQTTPNIVFELRPQGSDDITARDFHSFVDKKVSDIRHGRCVDFRLLDLSAPNFASSDCCMTFSASHNDDVAVAAAVHSLPNKTCASDPIPTWLLKECSAELVPILCCYTQHVSVVTASSSQRTSARSSRSLICME